MNMYAHTFAKTKRDRSTRHSPTPPVPRHKLKLKLTHSSAKAVMPQVEVDTHPFARCTAIHVEVGTHPFARCEGRPAHVTNCARGALQQSHAVAALEFSQGHVLQRERS